MQIITYPNSILETPTQKVPEVTPEVTRLISEMVATMRSANGVGLAAPQIGQSYRIAVIEYRPQKDETFTIPLLVLINPKIISFKAPLEVQTEGCLSLPGIEVAVPRATKIKVRAINEKGESIQFRASGLFARIVQHELDHLDGKLIIDYAENRQKAIDFYLKNKKVNE